MSDRRLVLMAKESNPAYFDGFWMSPRWLVEELTKGIDRFWSTAHTLPWPPEHAVFPHLQSHQRMAWSYALIPAVIVRSATRGECWRLRRKETPESVYDVQGTTWGRDPDAPTAPLLTFEAACERFLSRALNITTLQHERLRARGTTPTCAGWVQTIRCDPNGAQDTLVPRRGCHDRIQAGWSGYCECRRPPSTTVVQESSSACSHPPFTCAERCRRRAGGGARANSRARSRPIGLQGGAGWAHGLFRKAGDSSSGHTHQR